MHYIQGLVKRWALGFVNCDPAVGHHSCLAWLEHSRNLGPEHCIGNKTGLYVIERLRVLTSLPIDQTLSD